MKDFQERAQNKAENSKTKIDAMREELEERELKECTFAPKTLRQKEKRTLDDFLKDQQKHLDKKQENINRLQKDNEIKEESLMISHPTINEYSKVLTESKDKDEARPAYQRLYDKSKKPLPEQKPKEEAKNTPPEKRKEAAQRQQSLYEEAKKRKERMEARQKESKKKNTSTKDYSRDPHVQQKYMKEFGNALSSIDVSPVERLSYDKMSIINIIKYS